MCWNRSPGALHGALLHLAARPLALAGLGAQQHWKDKQHEAFLLSSERRAPPKCQALCAEGLGSAWERPALQELTAERAGLLERILGRKNLTPLLGVSQRSWE